MPLKEGYWQQGATCVHVGSTSCSSYDVLSCCSRQITPWRSDSISQVQKLNVPFGCLALNCNCCCKPKEATMQNQGLRVVFCLLTGDLGNRRHQRKREESESQWSSGRGLFRLLDQQNAKDQMRLNGKEYEAMPDLLLLKVNILPLEISVELSQLCAAENLTLLCSDQL